MSSGCLATTDVEGCWLIKVQKLQMVLMVSLLLISTVCSGRGRGQSLMVWIRIRKRRGEMFEEGMELKRIGWVLAEPVQK